MPQAPGQAPGLVPDVEPSSQGTPDVNLPVPVDAFGGAVGHALAALGQDVTEGSNKIWQQAVSLQNLNNETAAKEADSNALKDMALKDADFLNKEGLNAGPDALAQHIQDLQDIRMKYRQGLNPMAARMYDASALSNLGRYVSYAARHSGQQAQIASVTTANSRKTVIQNSIESDPDDEIAFQRGTNAIKAENSHIGEQLGWSPETLEANNQKDVSKFWTNRINAIAKTNAIGAQRMFDYAQKNELITPDDVKPIQATIQTQFRQQGSRIISDQVLAARRHGQDQDRTEQNYVDEADEKADEIIKQQNITDPSFKDFVRQRVKIDYSQQRSIERDQEYKDFQTVTRALDTPNSEGRLPTTVDQLKLIDPQVGAAIDRMRPTQQKAIGQRLLTNAMGKSTVPTEENQQRYQTLLGMAHSAPDSFLAVPLYNEAIPKFQRDQLLTIQKQMVKQAYADPRVDRALKVLGRDPEYAGINKKDDPDGYYNFVGALQDAISAQQHKDAKPLSDEEIKTIGNRLIQQQVVAKHSFWFDQSAPLYNEPVPEGDVARIASDPYWERTGQKPTAQQIHNVYVREQYNKLFKGSVGASEGAIVSGTVNSP